MTQLSLAAKLPNPKRRSGPAQLVTVHHSLETTEPHKEHSNLNIKLRFLNR